MEKLLRCYCRTKKSVPLECSTMARFLFFQPKKSFRKFVKYFWRYSISAGTVQREKLKFWHFLDVGEAVMLLLKTKISLHLTFSTTIATFLFFQPKKGKNWNFYISWMLEKLFCCYCKTKISLHLTFSTTLATFLFFQPKKSFRKFDKYFWKYSISAGSV